jgi:hypothetical protein
VAHERADCHGRRGQDLAEREWHISQGLEALHAFAKRLGLRREWFQDHRLAPHYDLVPARHAAALELGAELVDAYEQAKRRIEARRANGITSSSPQS